MKKSSREVSVLALAVLGVSICVACSPKPTSTTTTYFPESNEVQGWSKSGETRTFPADRLWEYIDGDAEKYTQAGVKETLTADYRYGENVDAVADVYVMSDAAGATKIFESEPAEGSKPVTLGDAAQLREGSLVFRKDRYFVRLVAYANTAEIPEALVALGRSITGKLK
jgi:Family of unknown function (DUF6599)